MKVNKEECIGCGMCVSECPKNAIKVIDGTAVIDKEKCIKCGICIDTCPVEAIKE